jgi:hypothetical protein
VLALVVGCAPKPSPLIGKWKADDKSVVEFTQDTFVLEGSVASPWREIDSSRFVWRPKPMESELVAQYKFEGQDLMLCLNRSNDFKRYKKD